jgi:amino acid transporter
MIGDAVKEASPDAPLVRCVNLRSAVAINAISMIGIGPLITVPLVLGFLHGPLSLVGWILGALLAICDGLVWAELGSQYPSSGGTYGYLREIFGRHSWGRFFAFLFVWQIIFFAPLNNATGYIGFANYAGFLFPAIAQHAWMVPAVAIGIGIVTLAALYRGISSASQIGTWLALAAVGTLVCVIVASYAHFSPAQAFATAPLTSFWSGLGAGLGQALIIAMYDYQGYNASSCVGGEVIAPARTIPGSILLAIALVAALYVTMQLGLLGAISWQAIVPLPDGSLPPLGQHVASAVVQQAFGEPAAVVVTVLILITAFASVYGCMLGYSRVPYAAAVDGVFLKPFAHLHPKQRFPDVALVVMGVIALIACFFKLDQVINALVAASVLVQSIAQIAALFVLRARGVRTAYRMWLFPVPALVALAGWAYIFIAAGPAAIAFGVVTLLAGAIVFFAHAWLVKEWPFAAPTKISVANGQNK